MHLHWRTWTSVIALAIMEAGSGMFLFAHLRLWHEFLLGFMLGPLWIASWAYYYGRHDERKIQQERRERDLFLDSGPAINRSEVIGLMRMKTRVLFPVGGNSNEKEREEEE